MRMSVPVNLAARCDCNCVPRDVPSFRINRSNGRYPNQLFGYKQFAEIESGMMWHPLNEDPQLQEPFGAWFESIKEHLVD